MSIIDNGNVINPNSILSNIAANLLNNAINSIDIIGLPPRVDSTIINGNNFQEDFFGIMEIWPGVLKPADGVSLFTIDLEKGEQEYISLVSSYGYMLSSAPLRVAFQADSFPSDTFSNQYDETFLSEIANVSTGGLSELVQMSGSSTASEALAKLSEALTGKNMLESNTTKITELLSGLNTFQHGIDVTNKLLAGQRMDFPKIWKNSSYSPSYTFTVRLYNPNPKSDEDTIKYILGPLAALLCLGLPQSEDGSTYKWPFLHKIECRGLFIMEPAFISSITVVKGGDQQHVAANQRPGIIDVRIDIGNLYDTMVVGSSLKTGLRRPTLKQYLDNLAGKKYLASSNLMMKKSLNNLIDMIKGGSSSLGREISGQLQDRVDSGKKAINSSLMADQPTIG